MIFVFIRYALISYAAQILFKHASYIILWLLNASTRESDLEHYFKPCLHIVVSFAEYACDDPSKRILKPGLHISRKDCKHMFVNMHLKLFRYGLVYTSLQ